jgi:hypothetical protein
MPLYCFGLSVRGFLVGIGVGFSFALVGHNGIVYPLQGFRQVRFLRYSAAAGFLTSGNLTRCHLRFSALLPGVSLILLEGRFLSLMYPFYRGEAPFPRCLTHV